MITLSELELVLLIAVTVLGFVVYRQWCELAELRGVMMHLMEAMRGVADKELSIKRDASGNIEVNKLKEKPNGN